MVRAIFKGGFDDNFTYLLSSADDCYAVIDPCGECAEYLAKEKIEPDKVRYILITHGHSDHLDAVDDVKKLYPDAAVCGSVFAEFSCDIKLADGEKLKFGNSEIEVIHTPGHSRDSVCYIYYPDRALFTGDTVFIGCIGFCRSPKIMADSLEKILALPNDLVVFSGHDYGGVPYRTLGVEKEDNPELSDSFIAELRKK